MYISCILFCLKIMTREINLVCTDCCVDTAMENFCNKRQCVNLAHTPSEILFCRFHAFRKHPLSIIDTLYIGDITKIL